MAIQGANGAFVSFYCSELMEELRADINEFGGSSLLYVISEIMEGVKIYKDYFFDDPVGQIPIKENEQVQCMTALALLEVYKLQNAII